MRRPQPYLRCFTAEFLTLAGIMRGDFYGRTDVAATRRAKTYAEARRWTFMSIRPAFYSAT
jgi:hypothetical protein